MIPLQKLHDSGIDVTDQFCGAGGSTTGAKDLGLDVKLALNHWALAIETHNTNHPETDHDCTDVSACDPRRYRSTRILITSPECTNHSLAKGKKRKYQRQLDLYGKVEIDPSEERSRATMWDVPRFAEFHGYDIIVVENVVDARRWRLWESWLHAMHALGYRHRCVYLNSMFCHPTPQSRDRLYVVFWKQKLRAPDLDFRPTAYCESCAHDVDAVQSWKPGRTWGKYRQQYVYHCPACAERVEPYYWAAFNCIDWSVPAKRIGERKRPLKKRTMERIRYGLEKYGRQPLVITTRYTSGTEFRAKAASTFPLPTQPGGLSHAALIPLDFAHNGAERGVSLTQPYPTQTTSQAMGLATAPFVLSLNYPHQPAKEVQGALDTVTASRPMGLVNPFFVRINEYPDKKGVDGGQDPLATVTTAPGRFAIACPPFIAELFGKSTARRTDEELGCVTAGAVNYGVVSPFVAELHGTSQARSLSDPLLCVTASGNHHALIHPGAFLAYYYGTMNASSLADAGGTVTTVDRASLVEGAPRVEDCTFRMLKPHEIKAAMAFAHDYVVLGTQREQVKQLGNAVTPPAMRMILERCVEVLK